MMLNKTRRRLLAVAVVGVIIAFVATGCDHDRRASPSSAFCGYIVGNGEGKNDNNRHHTLLPGETKDYYSDEEVVKYVPCNPRNYYVLPKGLDADRNTASLARTTDGTQVKVWTRAYWRLNQDQVALNNFYDVCAKFTCFSDRPVGGKVNASTPEWLEMLDEVFGPSVDQAAFGAVGGYTNEEGATRNGFNDKLWKAPSQAQYDRLATNMAEIWRQKVQVKTGFSMNLFCGTASSWGGEGKNRRYNCTSVVFEIYDVEPVKAKLAETAEEETQAEQELDVNQKKFNAAQKLYGPFTHYFLGLQDTCAKVGVTCVINLAGSNVPVTVTPKSGG